MFSAIVPDRGTATHCGVRLRPRLSCTRTAVKAAVHGRELRGLTFRNRRSARGGPRAQCRAGSGGSRYGAQCSVHHVVEAFVRHRDGVGRVQRERRSGAYSMHCAKPRASGAMATGWCCATPPACRWPGCGPNPRADGPRFARGPRLTWTPTHAKIRGLCNTLATNPGCRGHARIFASARRLRCKKTECATTSLAVGIGAFETR